jgi:hypothetical protein
MRLHPYRCESCDPTRNAQRNLDGRTYYANPDTLKYFKARILASEHHPSGALFCIIESLPMTHRNDKRGFRYRVFDLCGNVIAGKGETVDQFYSSSAAASKALRAALKEIDPVSVNREAIASHEKWHADGYNAMRKWLSELESKRAAAAA